MQSKTLKDKILASIACLLGVVIIGFLIYSGVVLVKAFAPEKPEVDNTEYEFTFTGHITLYDEEYDVSLKGKDEEFSVDANKIKGVTGGSYTFTQGQGWTFSFDDSSNTVVRSMYNKDDKTFSFIYTLDLGSRGKGNLRFSYTVDSFDAAAEKWGDIPSFGGTAAWFGGVLKAQILISCDADNNFNVVSTDLSVGEIDAISGTYAYEGGKYIFTLTDGSVITSETDEETGLQCVTMTIHRPSLDAYGAGYAPTKLTQVVLTVD